MKDSALSVEALEAAIGRLPVDALAPARRAALDTLRKTGMPTLRDEDWKYTDIRPLVDLSNQWLANPAPTSGEAVPSRIDDIMRSIDADWLVVRNGRIDEAGLRGLSVDGVTVSLLSDLGIERPASTQLGNLNTALLVDGLRIRITDGTRCRRPIGLLFADLASDSPVISQSRIDIVVDKSASVSVFECHVSAGEPGHYANAVVNLDLGEAAAADFVRLQERSRGHDQTARTSITVGRGAVLRHAAYDLGGKLIRNDLEVRVDEPGGHASISGLYLVGAGQHIDNHTRIDHVVGPTESRQEYRGILTGHARGVWNGKVIVHDGADGTDAEQSNHNLLLSRNAEINTKPELEIYADDVKCSHGTTVGQLDRDAMFYLRTRGLSRHEARQVLTRAFAQAIVSRTPIEALHEFLFERIALRLDELMLGADE